MTSELLASRSQLTIITTTHDGQQAPEAQQKAAELAAEARQTQKKVWGARLTIGVVVVAVAAAYLGEDEVDISRITSSQYCPRDKIKEFRHVPTFAVPPACPYVVRGFVGDGEWLGTKFLQRLSNAQGPPSIEYDELSRGNMFTYYDKQRHSRCPRRRLTVNSVVTDSCSITSRRAGRRVWRPLRQISPIGERDD